MTLPSPGNATSKHLVLGILPQVRAWEYMLLLKEIISSILSAYSGVQHQAGKSWLQIKADKIMKGHWLSLKSMQSYI